MRLGADMDMVTYLAGRRKGPGYFLDATQKTHGCRRPGRRAAAAAVVAVSIQDPDRGQPTRANTGAMVGSAGRAGRGQDLYFVFILELL